MKIVRNPEPKTHKVVPIYPLEPSEPAATMATNQSNYNVVMVQPNNFLAAISAPSSPIDSNKLSTTDKPITPDNLVISNEIKSYQVVTSTGDSENADQHHRSVKKKILKNCLLMYMLVFSLHCSVFLF